MRRHLFARTSLKATVSTLAAGFLTAGAVAFGAAPAQAATIWDSVAHCESGGNWSINTGNGYYGGLQFSASTWRGFGGGEFAPYAHQATREQQIVVAQRVLQKQGPRAWPTCSRKTGLTVANGSVPLEPTGPVTAEKVVPKVRKLNYATTRPAMVAEVGVKAAVAPQPAAESEEQAPAATQPATESNEQAPAAPQPADSGDQAPAATQPAVNDSPTPVRTLKG